MDINSVRSSERIFARKYGICETRCSACNCPTRVWLILRNHGLTAEHCLANPDIPIWREVFDEIANIPIDVRSILANEHPGCEHIDEVFAPMRDFLPPCPDDEL